MIEKLEQKRDSAVKAYLEEDDHIILDKAYKLAVIVNCLKQEASLDSTKSMNEMLMKELKNVNLEEVLRGFNGIYK